MEMNKLRTLVGSGMVNTLGWRTRRKIFVIESDDWGAIRMPSREIRNNLINQGINIEKSYFATNDCLESEDDLNALFETLRSVKDKNGRCAVMTADSVVANPDFDAIKKSGFQKYIYEPFTRTLERYGDSHKNTFQLWKQGMNEGVFRPQFHGREHLNVIKWMRDLRVKDPMVHLMFDQRHWALSPLNTDLMKIHYLDGFSGITDENIAFYEASIKQGLELFFKLFGFHSKSFIAQCYRWGNAVESILNDNHVRYIQGMFVRRDAETLQRKYQILGSRNKYGQIYLLRNVSFEPVISGYKESVVDEALLRIKVAFALGKPVTLSSHRVNYIGSLNENNRTESLKLLRKLLKKVVRLYPDVEFMSSDQLGDIILNG